MQSNNKVTSFLVLLVLILVVVGFGFFSFDSNNDSDMTPDSSDKPTTNPVKPTPSGTPTTKPKTLSVYDKNLTSDELSLLNVMRSNLTGAEDKARFDLANKIAVATDKLVINDCTANPVSLKTKIGKTIAVSNQGKKEIHFGFGPKPVLISPGKSINYLVDFKTGPGTYGYGCDDPSLTRAIGLFLVTP